MTRHATSHPRRIEPKTHDRGTAHALHQHGNRLKTAEATSGVIGTGATIVGATVQSSAGGGNPSNYFPGIVYDGTGLRAYNSGGVITMSISAADGSLTVNGTGVITGGTIQTSVSNPKVIMDASGIRAYNAGGSNTFNLDGSSGNLTIGSNATITGSVIQTSSGVTAKVIMDNAGIRAYDATGNNTISIDTSGSLNVSKGSITLSSTIPAGTGARVTLDSTGIKAYNASNANMFTLDGTTGLITATGVLTAQTGSNIPTATISGLLPGSNRYSNSNFQQGQLLFDTTGWSTINATLSDGGTSVPIVYGSRTCKLTAIAAGAAGIYPTNFTDSYRRVVPGLNYTFSHYVYPASVARNTYIDIYFYDSAGAQLAVYSDVTGAATTLNTWMRYSRTFQAPAGAAYSLGVHYIVPAAGEIYYFACFQMEEGDRVSAYAPRSDEVLVNQINANNINVANLSAISANLGTVTAGTITGVTITGATIQTAVSSPHTVLDSVGFYVTDGSGVKQVQIDATSGLQIRTGSNAINTIEFVDAIGGTAQGSIQHGYTAGVSSFIVIKGDNAGACNLQVSRNSNTTLNNYVTAKASDAAGTRSLQVTIVDGGGNSSFLQLTGVIGAAARYINFGSGLATIPSGGNNISITGISHGFSSAPVGIWVNSPNSVGFVPVFGHAVNIGASTFDISLFTLNLSTASSATNVGYEWVALGP